MYSIVYNVGEAAADRFDYLVIHSSMAQLAELLHGIIIVMEHRFYGASSTNAETFFVSDQSIKSLVTTLLISLP